MTNKICLYCGKEFTPDWRNRKKQMYCSGTECRRKHWRQLNPEKNKAENKRYMDKVRNDPARNAKYRESAKKYWSSKKGRYLNYKNSARELGREFTLTKEQFLSFWDKPCTYCGESIEGIGIDRIDNEIGYIIENCTSCCITCNNMKRTLTQEIFIKKCNQISATRRL